MVVVEVVDLVVIFGGGGGVLRLKGGFIELIYSGLHKLQLNNLGVLNSGLDCDKRFCIC